MLGIIAWMQLLKMISPRLKVMFDSIVSLNILLNIRSGKVVE